MDYFQLRQFGILPTQLQIAIILLLFVAMALYRYRIRSSLTREQDQYSVHFTHMFAPIYEEIIFRGLILQGLLTLYSATEAIIISSIIFGLWHLKNIFVSPKKKVLYQVLYAGVVFSPVVSWLMIVTHTIWIGVIIHYFNNFWVYGQWHLYKKFGLLQFINKLKRYI